MTNIKANIKPVIFCLLSTIVSVYCIYQLILAIFTGESEHLHITGNAIMNALIDTVSTFNERLQAKYLIGVGLLALLFELLFSDSLHEFFSRLPLGSRKKYDYFEACDLQHKKGKLMRLFKHSVWAIAPALIIGFYIVIYLAFYSFFPDKLDLCVKWGLPIITILTLAALGAIGYSVFKFGGLWGTLIRLPLILTSNLCLCTLIGVIIISFGFIIAFLLAFVLSIIVLVPATLKIIRYM